MPRTTWLRKEKTENVGEWKARVFDVHNVVFSFRTLKATSAGRKDFALELAGDKDGGVNNEFLPLEIRWSSTPVSQKGQQSRAIPA